jgi:hypothetical protein
VADRILSSCISRFGGGIEKRSHKEMENPVRRGL